MLMLTKEQWLSAICFAAALSFMYVLPTVVVVSHTVSIFIGEAGGVAIGMFVLIKGIAKVYRWCLGIFQ